MISAGQNRKETSKEGEKENHMTSARQNIEQRSRREHTNLKSERRAKAVPPHKTAVNAMNVRRDDGPSGSRSGTMRSPARSATTVRASPLQSDQSDCGAGSMEAITGGSGSLSPAFAGGPAMCVSCRVRPTTPVSQNETQYVYKIYVKIRLKQRVAVATESASDVSGDQSLK